MKYSSNLDKHLIFYYVWFEKAEIFNFQNWIQVETKNVQQILNFALNVCKQEQNHVNSLSYLVSELNKAKSELNYKILSFMRINFK